MLELQLYYRPTCPFCRRVLDYMDKKKISLDLKDIMEKANQDRLIKVGGKSQVPCLFINGKAMYESDDIIQWLGVNC